jgi:hypothetical protein
MSFALETKRRFAPLWRRYLYLFIVLDPLRKCKIRDDDAVVTPNGETPLVRSFSPSFRLIFDSNGVSLPLTTQSRRATKADG